MGSFMTKPIVHVHCRNVMLGQGLNAAVAATTFQAIDDEGFELEYKIQYPLDEQVDRQTIHDNYYESTAWADITQSFLSRETMRDSIRKIQAFFDSLEDRGYQVVLWGFGRDEWAILRTISEAYDIEYNWWYCAKRRCALTVMAVRKLGSRAIDLKSLSAMYDGLDRFL